MRYFKLCLSLLLFSVSCYAEKPDLMLLENYQDQNVIGWVMSEKLDGEWLSRDRVLYHLALKP